MSRGDAVVLGAHPLVRDQRELGAAEDFLRRALSASALARELRGLLEQPRG